MEDSTSTALYTGAFIMVFVASLTISLFLFNSILDFSELAYDYNINVADNQTILNVPVGTERLLSAEEVASYYYNYVSFDLYGGDKNNETYNVQIYTSTNINSSNLLKADQSLTYRKLIDRLGSNTTYILSYELVNNGKPVIIIKQATNDQINSML